MVLGAHVAGLKKAVTGNAGVGAVGHEHERLLGRDLPAHDVLIHNGAGVGSQYGGPAARGGGASDVVGSTES